MADLAAVVARHRDRRLVALAVHQGAAGAAARGRVRGQPVWRPRRAAAGALLRRRRLPGQRPAGQLPREPRRGARILVARSNEAIDEAGAVRKSMLGAIMLFTAQGVPMLYSGQELARRPPKRSMSASCPGTTWAATRARRSTTTTPRWPTCATPRPRSRATTSSRCWSTTSASCWPTSAGPTTAASWWWPST